MTVSCGSSTSSDIVDGLCGLSTSSEIVDGYHEDQVLALVFVDGLHVNPLDRPEVLLFVLQVSEPTKIFFFSYYVSSNCVIVLQNC